MTRFNEESSFNPLFIYLLIWWIVSEQLGCRYESDTVQRAAVPIKPNRVASTVHNSTHTAPGWWL